MGTGVKSLKKGFVFIHVVELIFKVGIKVWTCKNLHSTQTEKISIGDIEEDK